MMKKEEDKGLIEYAKKLGVSPEQVERVTRSRKDSLCDMCTPYSRKLAKNCTECFSVTY